MSSVVRLLPHAFAVVLAKTPSRLSPLAPRPSLLFRPGFTLVEMMVAMGLTIFLMVILSQCFVQGLETFSGLKTIGDMQEELRTAMTLFILEVAIVLLMAVIVMVSGGAHGISAAPLTPSASPSGFQGLVTGGVFAALSFVGF